MFRTRRRSPVDLTCSSVMRPFVTIAILVAFCSKDVHCRPSSSEIIYDMLGHCHESDAAISMKGVQMMVLRANMEDIPMNCSIKVQSLDKSSGLIAYINKLVLKGAARLSITSSNDELMTGLPYTITTSSKGPKRDFSSRPSINSAIKVELETSHADFGSFEIIFTTFSEKPSAWKRCPRSRAFDCRKEHICISDKLRCNKWNNCGNDVDELDCPQKSRHSNGMFLAILLRLFIFFLIVVALRIACVLVSCRSSRMTQSDDTCPLPEADLPPPYSSVIGQLVGSSLWKPETPPPTYKAATKLDKRLKREERY